MSGEPRKEFKSCFTRASNYLSFCIMKSFLKMNSDFFSDDKAVIVPSIGLEITRGWREKGGVIISGSGIVVVFE